MPWDIYWTIVVQVIIALFLFGTFGGFMINFLVGQVHGGWRRVIRQDDEKRNRL